MMVVVDLDAIVTNKLKMVISDHDAMQYLKMLVVDLSVLCE